MKRLLILLAMTLTMCMTTLAQETAHNLRDTKIERHVATLDIEGQTYENVKVTLQSVSPSGYLTGKHKVKVKVVDAKGKKIWKKTIYDSFLFVFSNGQVQVGKQTLSQIVIYHHMPEDRYTGKVREFEGIFN